MADQPARNASVAEHVLDACPWLVVRFDPDDLAVTFVTRNVGWLLGYSPGELMGAGLWREVLDQDDAAELLRRLREATAGVMAQCDLECRCRTRDGRLRWLSVMLRIEYDEEARATGVTAYAHDIADRRAAEEEARRAQSFSDLLFEHLPAVVFVKEARELRYVRVNRAAEDLLGIRRADVLGRTDADLYPPALAAEYLRKDRQVLATGMPLDIPEEVVAVRGGEPRVLHTKKIPLHDESGGAAYVLAVSVDITALRTAHEEARLARLEAERANRAKNEFLSRMSHDLRTPLNAVLGFAQILQMETPRPEQVESIEQILRGGTHLLGLINEVLDIARIESGQLSLSPEPVPVADVIQQVVDLSMPLGSYRRITVSADLSAGRGVHVRADRQRLRQVLMNLVSNAVKYNRDEGQVRLAFEPHGGRVVIRVSDTGPGIRADRLNLLFHPFERLGAEQSSIEGTGLGLAVSKGLTEAMGGRIGVDSAVDVGSTFWVELPEVEAPAPRDAAAAAEGMPLAAAASGTVLYVEDNRSNVRLLERLLARRPGVRLVQVGTGQHALETISSDRPDLVLLDLHLPDMPGEEVLRRLWASPDSRSIPVAVLSADATPRQQQRLLAAGAVAYLTKPFDVAALLRLVDERLGRTASPQEIDS